MSVTARSRLLAHLQQAGLSTARAEANLDAFAHELAEQIRGWAAVQVSGETEEIYGYAADLVDPQAEDYIGTVPVRPGEETT